MITEKIKEYLELSKKISIMEKEIKKFIADNGNVIIDGREYGNYPLIKNVRKVDAGMLANCAISAGIPRDEFYSAVKITLKDAKPIAAKIGLTEDAYTIMIVEEQKGFGFVPEKSVE